jgi:hypothetical protein
MAYETEFENSKEGTYSYEADGETIVKARRTWSPKTTEIIQGWDSDLNPIDVEHEILMNPADIENGGLLCIIWYQKKDGSGWFVRKKEYVKNSVEPTVVLEEFDEDGKLTNSVTK